MSIPDTLILCPFHPSRVGRPDKQPSLHISPNGWAYCHGCGWKGRVFDHPELLQGVNLNLFRTPVETQDFDLPPLERGPLEYLLSRGFTEGILRHFGVGGNAEKVWIPVKLRDGRIVGIIFRFLPGIGEGRYVYSYGFSKRNYVFGSPQFEKDGDYVCLVEGSLDCIRMHQLGMRNTIAILGNQPTSGQLDLVKCLGHQVVLAFDNDEPGRTSALKVGRLLMQRGHMVYLLEYEGSDPGSLTSTSSFKLSYFLETLLTSARIDFCSRTN